MRVSGGVLCTCRASLVASGLWESVRLGFAARLEVDPEELEQITPQEWLPLESLQALMGALSERLELDTIKTLTRRHVTAPHSSNFYAPMLRSWSRSFEQSPQHMLRGVSPLWRAALRHAGDPIVVPFPQGGETHVLLKGPVVPVLVASPALCSAFEGLLLGLLDLVRPRPMLAEVETTRTNDTLCFVCRF